MKTVTANKGFYHKIKFHQILMMKKRGYVLSDVERRIIEGNIDESMMLFDDYYVKPAQSRGVPIENLLDTVYRDSKGNSISVIYVEVDPGEKQVKKAVFDALATCILADTFNRNVLFISRVKWTTEGYKQFAGYPIFNIEYMLYRELIYNPIAHEFQPSFRLLTDDERKIVVGKLGKQGSSVLHRFATDDPVVKYLGAKPGQIIKILRKADHIAGVDEMMYYRIVVNALLFEDKDKKPKEKVAT